MQISIHALHEEGDAPRTRNCPAVLVFLSTPSMRRATLVGRNNAQNDKISIHALHEEGDFVA